MVASSLILGLFSFWYFLFSQLNNILDITRSLPCQTFVKVKCFRSADENVE